MNERGQDKPTRVARRARSGRAAFILLSALAAILPWASTAASPASVEHGRRLAEVNCKACHTIAGHRPSPVAGAPPFAELQQLAPGRSLDELFAKVMTSSHPPMPSFLGSAAQRRDLLDYIRSVEAVPPPG